MKFRQILLVVVISAASAVGSVALYNYFTHSKTDLIGSAQNGLPANYAGYFDGKNFSPADPFDFTKAANTAAPAVVHIKTKIPAKKVSNDLPRRRSMLDDFFGDIFGDMGPNIVPEQRASGSGVIISEDGYIVTNNHVITNEANGNVADEITVTLHNRKTFKARVIGRDPSSDVAVLKIDGSSLPYLVYGNSDDIRLGQWVLAIGYPLTLETTVTAGIISATGRAININSRQTQKGETPVESFIQTDAAVNSGNSGGALVNIDG
ncbi:MAG TPA: trypsin-like peptidase domain-containing protein, partial [Flavisolibacter sp.]|nr:trypsin-like peptidase domain-containing protein [Flavisolibacter sp.]